jgi:hypothetical protein
MRRFKLFAASVAVLFAAVTARANSASLSYTGTLATSQSSFTLVFTVGGGSTQSIDFQTWGFGGTNGGTNAAGVMISPGGFDPLLALFGGTGSGASLVNGTSDDVSNFGSFVGCAPAGTVGFSNGDAVCGDINMSLLLAPGTYTLVLSDAAYIPNSFFDNGTLGEGFTDFTGGAFQTCDTNVSSGVMSCITASGNWAFDITDAAGANLSVPAGTPEPATYLLAGTGLLFLAWRRRERAKAFHRVRIG